jgi:plastocyanin domain-containing protein
MLIINVIGVLLIALIAWWFWLYKPAGTHAQGGDTKIVVENGVYTPARLHVPANTPTSLQFLRKDQSPCAAMVQFPDLEVSEELAVDKVVQVPLPALAKGEYPFTCQMQMYRGVLVVE